MPEILHNEWKPEYVDQIMAGLAEYNPRNWQINPKGRPEDRITVACGDNSISIERPEQPYEDWFYHLTYYFSEVPPFGFSMSLALYDDEEYVIDRVKRIIEAGGITLTEEQLNEIAEWEEANFPKDKKENK